MRKRKFFTSFALAAALLLAAAAMAVSVPAALAADAPSVTNEKIRYQDVVETTAAAFSAGDGNTTVTTRTLVDYETYVGTVERPRAFTSATNNELKWLPGDAAEPVAAFGSWYIRSSGLNQQAVIKFTAKYPVRVTMSNSAVTGTWAKNSYFDSYVERDGRLMLIDSKHTGSAGTAAGENIDIAAGALDVTAHLEVGDSFFYAFRAASGMQELQNPAEFAFTFDYTAFDPDYVPAEYVRTGDDSSDWATLVSNLVARGGKTFKGNGVDVDLFAGKIGSSARFDAVVADGFGEAADALTYGDWKDGTYNETSGRLVRWEARGNSVLKFTAKTDVALTLDFSGIYTWSKQMTCLVYAESGETLLKLLTVPVTAENAESAQSVKATVQLKAGDAAYFAVSGKDLINIGGSFSASRSGYSAAGRPPYEEAAELVGYAEAKSDKDYTAEGKQAIDDIVTAAVNELGTTDDAAAVLAAAKSDIDAVPRGKDFSDIAAELIAVDGHAEAENALVKYAAGTGTPDSITAFPIVSVDALKNETLEGQPEHDNHINPEQLRAKGNVGTVLKFTAKTNAQLVLSFTAKTTWAYTSRFTLYAESGDNRIPLYAGTFTETSDEQTVEIRAAVHAAAGDAVYLVMTTDGSRNTVGFSGTVTEGAYDAEKRPDYVRAAQIAGLADEKNYTSEGWKTVESIIFDNIVALDTATDRDAVVEAARNAVAAVDMGKEYAALVADIAATEDYGPLTYAAAEMGLYASSSVRSGDFRRMTGLKADTLYYTTLDKADVDVDQECQVSLAPHQILSHGLSAVISVKALKNMQVTVTVPQLGADYHWVVEGETPVGADVVYFLNDGARTYKVKSTEVVKTGGDYGYTAHLKAGDTLYYTILSDWTTVDLLPAFVFGNDYDPEWTFDVIKDPTETYVWQNMVSAQVLSGGGEQYNDLVDWQFSYGETLDSLEPFDVHTGKSEPEHALYVGTVSDPSCAAWRWQWRVSNPYLTVLTFKATENIYLEMKHGAISLADYVPGVYVKTVVENADGIRITRKTYVPKVNNPADSYFSSEHLAKGDTLYLILEPIDREAGSFPHTLAMTSTESETTFRADTKAYDASLRANYAFEEELIAYRAAKAAEIRAYVDTLNESDYSVSNWLVINEYADKFEADTAELNDKAEIDAAFAAAKANIGAVPTAANEKAELDAYKTQKKAELAAYAKESDYTAENWKTITEYIETANASIDAAKSMTGVDTAVSAARNRIDRIEKKAAEKGCGCGGAAAGGGTLLAALALAAVLFALLKRKKQA